MPCQIWRHIWKESSFACNWNWMSEKNETICNQDTQNRRVYKRVIASRCFAFTRTRSEAFGGIWTNRHHRHCCLDQKRVSKFSRPEFHSQSGVICSCPQQYCSCPRAMLNRKTRPGRPLCKSSFICFLISRSSKNNILVAKCLALLWILFQFRVFWRHCGYSCIDYCD